MSNSSWIPADQIKPCFRAEVLFYSEESNGRVALGYYCGMGKWYLACDKLVTWKISHWMPAPPRPVSGINEQLQPEQRV